MWRKYPLWNDTKSNTAIIEEADSFDDTPFLNTAQQVAVYSKRLESSAKANHPDTRQSNAVEYVDDALKTVTIRGRQISPFAPYRSHISAFHTFTRSQRLTLFLLTLTIIITSIFYGKTLLIVSLALLMTLYLGDLLFTFILSTQTLSQSSEEHINDKVVHALIDAEWPTYTILCPLYREVEVVPQFVKAMQDLDYPTDKLQILFLTEDDDAATRSALASLGLPAHFSIITVPAGEPRTKPRACNFGLLRATGDYIVIYDAEDIPDPLQLKKAVLTFSKNGPDLACVQAKLNFYNPAQNLLTRWFTAEYSLWFDLTLPGLQRAGLPLPLGGTSNHFRAETLRLLGAWDPFNVTEDCDLGQRLARFHMRTAILNSTTYEEANSRPKNWLRQRSRWIKGYMQTYLVYMRRPWQYLHRGRMREFLALQLIIGGKTAVLFMNPLMWLLLIAYFVFRPYTADIYQTLFPRPILYMGSVCLVFGNFFYIYSHLIGCMKRGRYDLAKSTLLIPIYWGMTSVAGFIALYQLIFKPHYWEKTQHGLHLRRPGTFIVYPDVSIVDAVRAQTRGSTTVFLPFGPTVEHKLVQLNHVVVNSGSGEKKAILSSVNTPLVHRNRARKEITIIPAKRSLDLVKLLQGMQSVARSIRSKDPWLLATLLVACSASIAALCYFYQTDQILTYGDSYSHLLIARRIIDSATPGLAQVGGVWLPLPHLLMLPFIWNDTLWRTGLAGSFVAMPCYVIASIYLFLAAKRITHNSRASFVGTLLFVLNLNVLYLQVTPLSEMVLIASLLMACYHFVAWAQDDDVQQLILAALGTFLATLSRYDGWFLFLAFLALIVLIGWLKRQKWSQIEGNFLTFGSLGGLGIVLWIIWCWIIFGDPLYWQRGPFSSQAQQESLIKLNILYTYHNIWQAMRYFTLDSIANVGSVTFIAGVVAFIIYLFPRRYSPGIVAGLVFVIPFVFYVVSLYDGQAALYVTSAVPASAPNGLYNARYGVQSVAPVAFFVAVLLDRLPFLLSSAHVHYNRAISAPALLWHNTWSFCVRAVQRIPPKEMRVAILLISLFAIIGQGSWTAINGIVSLQDGLYGLDCAPGHASIVYLTQHYDGGRILEDTFTSPVADVSFKNVIYEGSGSLWKLALGTPTAWVEWILVDPTNKNDIVAEYIDVHSNAFLANYASLVQEPKGLMLFRLKGMPRLPTNSVSSQVLNKHAQCGLGDPNHKK